MYKQKYYDALKKEGFIKKSKITDWKLSELIYFYKCVIK